MATKHETTRNRVLTLVDEFDRKLSKTNGQLGCSMFGILALIPVIFLFVPDFSIIDRGMYGAGSMFSTIAIFITLGLSGDKRKLAEMVRRFNEEFPPGTQERTRAIQVLKNSNETKNKVIKKMLEQLPLAERDAVPVEQVVADVSRQLKDAPFPASSVPFPERAEKAKPPESTHAAPPERITERYIPLEIEPDTKES